MPKLKRRTIKNSGCTVDELMFVDQYMIDRNGTQAVLRMDKTTNNHSVQDFEIVVRDT
jgi:hypothetical protein